MKKSYPTLFVLFALFLSGALSAQSAFINEINYLASNPNSGLEIAGDAGQNLQGWSVIFYGADGAMTSSRQFGSRIIPNQDSGKGSIWFEMEQYSGTNGVALMNPTGTIEHFVSYGLGGLLGLTAVDGPASGMTADYAGTQLLPLQSLQLTGIGTGLQDFVWSLPLTFTPGEINTFQDFVGGVVGGLLGGLFGYETETPVGELHQQSTDNQFSISAFPNPVLDFMRLQRTDNNGLQGTLPVHLFDASGRLVKRTQMAQDQYYLDLDLRDLSAGYYLLRVGEGPGANVQKIVKK